MIVNRNAGFIFLTLALGGCAAFDAPRNVATTQQSDADLRDAIQQLIKIHADRMQFSGFVGMPFIHSVDKDVSQFSDWMGEQNKTFHTQLVAYAKKKNIDARYNFGPDILSQSQKLMEKSQGEILMNAGGNFSHYVVLFAFIDHHWGKSVVETALADLPNLDPELRAILERDLEMHKQAAAKIAELIKKYKVSK